MSTFFEARRCTLFNFKLDIPLILAIDWIKDIDCLLHHPHITEAPEMSCKIKLSEP